MATKTEDLTQVEYGQLRNSVANILAQGEYPGLFTDPEPSDYLTAERLIDAGYINVDKVLNLSS